MFGVEVVVGEGIEEVVVGEVVVGRVVEGVEYIIHIVAHHLYILEYIYIRMIAQKFHKHIQNFVGMHFVLMDHIVHSFGIDLFHHQ
jgi:hypothetical protein